MQFKSRRYVISLSLFFSSLLFLVNAKGDEMNVTDGPYIRASSNKLFIDCIVESRHQQLSIPLRQTPTPVQNCGYPVNIEQTQFAEQKVLSYTTEHAVAAASDFHGQYDLMKQLLTNNGIIDAQGNWAFGKGHFVITGDVFDRGDKVTEILWFLYHLEHQAEKAGGKVHLLLGNHEVMVLNGDIRYLHDKYKQTAKLLSTDFEQLFSAKTVLGQWLRSKPVLVKINDALYAHGGFHPELAKKEYSLEEINRVFKHNLVKAELPSPRVGFGRFLHKGNGPIWYRGYFKDDGATSEEIDLLLNHFSVAHIIVGHTSQEKIETRHKGKVIAIDTSIKNGHYGEILLKYGGKLHRGTLDGKLLLLQ